MVICRLGNYLGLLGATVHEGVVAKASATEIILYSEIGDAGYNIQWSSYTRILTKLIKEIGKKEGRMDGARRASGAPRDDDDDDDDDNIAPENRPLEKEIPNGNPPFLGAILVLGRVYLYLLFHKKNEDINLMLGHSVWGSVLKGASSFATWNFKHHKLTCRTWTGLSSHKKLPYLDVPGS